MQLVECSYQASSCQAGLWVQKGGYILKYNLLQLKQICASSLVSLKVCWELWGTDVIVKVQQQRDICSF